MLIMSERGELEIEATQYGTWVGKNGNIDIILEDEKGKTVIGFCHTGPDAMSLKDLEWLIFCPFINPVTISAHELFKIGSQTTIPSYRWVFTSFMN